MSLVIASRLVTEEDMLRKLILVTALGHVICGCAFNPADLEKILGAPQGASDECTDEKTCRSKMKEKAHDQTKSTTER
jgi:hypothetical protein